MRMMIVKTNIGVVLLDEVSLLPARIRTHEGHSRT